MIQLLVRYIDALIPLTAAAVALLFPQSLTKLDLRLPENQGTAGKIRLAGRILLAAAVLLALGSLARGG